MELVNPASNMVLTDEMNFFTTAPTMTPVVEWVKINPNFPLATLSDSQIIEFYNPGSPLEFTQLSKIKLVTEGVVTKADGSAINEAALAKVVLASNIHHGQFSNLEVSLQERVIENSNNLYHYQTHIQQLINHDEQSIKNELSMSGFFLDKGGKLDDIAGADGLDAIKSRAALIKTSKRFTLIGPLMCTLVAQHKLLIPNCSLRVKLIKNSQNHILNCAAGVAGGTYIYKLTGIKLLIPKVRLSVNATLAVESTLRKTPAKYQIERITNSYVSIPTGVSTTVLEGIYSG
jgi:hypothetical protein